MGQQTFAGDFLDAVRCRATRHTKHPGDTVK
jgi:hypothetical protein